MRSEQIMDTVLWISNAVGFAGPDYTIAIFEPEARLLLSRIESTAHHYEVRASTASPSPGEWTHSWLRSPIGRHFEERPFACLICLRQSTL
jgi:hypothetical protein